jgi:peptidoglycan/xylan/chitin deacetylase (PgdA/CDA1 family)
MITIDFDAELGILGPHPDYVNREKTLSVGRYGALRGVDRILSALADHHRRSTWFVPGRNAENHPGQVREIAAAQHEIECHGYLHEDFDSLDLAGQTDAVIKGRDAIENVTGFAPHGFRIPTGEWASGLDDVLVDLGFTWSSSWRGDDLPYFHVTRSRRALVEIPLHYELEDYGYFFYNLDPPFPRGQSRIAGYREVLDNWCREFDAYRRFGLAFGLRLQPEVIGTPGRITLLREFLDYAESFEDVWWCTGGELAAWWRDTAQDNDQRHPAEVFARVAVNH